MKRAGWLLACALCAPAHARLADGWAGQQGGTSGGGTAAAVIVTNPTQLRAALDANARMIQIVGVIDMRDGRPFTSSADQTRRSVLRLASDTTLAGIGSGAGLLHANVVVARAKNVIIRNLNFRNPCDVDPVWDPRDGAKGNWNSLFDAITVSASTNVWIDHNSFTDAPDGDERAPTGNGMLKQCHDGALDINQGADLITVSYNRFALHEKNTLVGSSDKATGDAGKLRVTFHHNLFENVSARAPRVRFGQVHLYNNYHRGDRRHPVYPHEYSVGMGKNADVIGDANAYDIAGARGCGDVVHTWSTQSSFTDHGSSLNGAALAGCTHPSAPAWQVPYPFSALPAQQVRAHVLGQAGAGNWHIDSNDDGSVTGRDAGPELALPAGDFYIEAQLRAYRPAGQLYLLERQDAANWRGAGLVLADGVLSVDIVRMRDGVLTRLKQVRRPYPATPDWNRLRFEVAGPLMSVYLDGEKLASATDPAASAQRGTVAFNSRENAFAIADAAVGPASDKPARIGLVDSSATLFAQAGDAPLRLTVNAVAGDGSTPLSWSARSSDPAVATVERAGTSIVVTARRAGSAGILLVAPGATRTLSLSVGAAFVKPAGSLRASVSPPAGARGVPVDTLLRLRLRQAQQRLPGSADSIRIFRKRDGVLVDVIRAVDAIANIGTAHNQRYLRANPVSMNGHEVLIKPHAGVLEYGTEYVVAIGAGMFDGDGGSWSFRTRAARPTGTTLTVDDDGPADFRTVQGALNHVMEHVPRALPVLIRVRNGSYDERLLVRGKDRLTIRGESRDGVLIHTLNNEAIHAGAGRTLLLAQDADLLTLENLTLRNDTLRSQSASGQAETVLFDSDQGRLIARNASFISEQDTLQLKGYAWFYRTLVAGNVDFIWGANRVALFEQSEIRSLGDSSGALKGGYIVQARTVSAGDRGFVFLDSVLTHAAGPAGNDVPPGSTYLARSPGTATTWDNVAFINCRMDAHIAAGGWAGSGAAREPAPNPALADALRGWREYGSRDLAGNHLDLGQRATGFQLDAATVQQHFGNRAAIFAAFDGGRGWDPQP
ncbi:MAG TPA: pectinesterase family protein [Telluria sp.]|jgi:pectate lyase/pectin methylesterase-like acyl-CoA thioesterase